MEPRNARPHVFEYMATICVYSAEAQVKTCIKFAEIKFKFD